MGNLLYSRILWRCFSLILSCWSIRAQAQTCTSTLFAKNLEINGAVAAFLLPLPGGGTILGGMSSGSISNVSLVKTSPGGSIVWNRQITFPRYSPVTRAALSSDHHLVVAHASTVALLDTNGVLLRSVTVNLPFGSLDLKDMKVDATGSVAVLYRNIYSTGDGYELVKLSADLSTLVWNRHFGSGNAYFSHLAADGRQLFACGAYSEYQNGALDGTLLSFDGASGQIVKQVSYRLDGYATNLNTLHPLKDGYLLEGFYQPNNTPLASTSHALLRLDTALQPVRAVRVTGVLNTEPLFVSPDAYGGYYGLQGSWGIFFYCNARDSVLWTRGIRQFWGFGVENFAHTTTNLYSLERNCNALYKADLNGSIGGCFESDQPFGTVGLLPDTVVKLPIGTSTTALTLTADYLPVIDQPFQVAEACSYTGECSSVTITGPSAVCTSGAAVRFQGRRNSGCRLPVEWEVLGAPVLQDRLNDSTLSVQFQQGGRYQLVARLPGNCATLTDTLTLTVSLTRQPTLSLGPDQELCAGNTLTLNARKGYASYRWQDGSPDSTYTVTQPGLYYVTTTNACGSTFSDSVRVTAAPPIPFDLGPNRSKCNLDSLLLSVPSGFLNYTWSNNYNISSTTSQSVVVNPLVDTAYYVKAEKSPGCFAYDTVRVSVYTAPPINLGADRQFCLGDSAVLNAGSGFQVYQWSTGENNPSITVKTKGSYSVIGSTPEGCKSYDTLQVLQVYPLPAVLLDKNPTLCKGESRVLDAGVFATYLWQDQSTGRTFTATDTGHYSVRVTDNHGCRGSDATTVAMIQPPPQGFLPPDTAICSFGKPELRPRVAFQSYLWSTGSTTPSITITQPGVYWLEAKDNHNCTGKDSVTVSLKECPYGFYVPTAFTPNGDGQNDVFRPLLIGQVKKYLFTIYNRWGQVVFQTREPARGWDGKVAGLKQDTNAFVWTCNYQFEGDVVKMEKGTVLLLK